jgi:hypothetical protein
MKETTDEQKATEERVFQDRQYQVATSFLLLSHFVTEMYYE